MVISRIKPMTMITQAQSGVCGAGVGGADADGGGASVWKLKVVDQSLGVGSSAMTLQK